MGWIRDDYDFGRPVKTFLISQRQLVILQTIRGKLRDNQHDPETLCRFFTELIETNRPELKGVSVLGMSIGGGMAYEVQCVHPSFERKGMVGEWPKEELVPFDQELESGYATKIEFKELPADFYKAPPKSSSEGPWRTQPPKTLKTLPDITVTESWTDQPIILEGA